MSGGQGVVSAGRQNGNRLFEAVIHPDEQDQKRAIDFGVQLDFSDGFARFVEKVSRTRDLLKLMGSSYASGRSWRVWGFGLRRSLIMRDHRGLKTGR